MAAGPSRSGERLSQAGLQDYYNNYATESTTHSNQFAALGCYADRRRQPHAARSFAR